jgi:hypothetical protein
MRMRRVLLGLAATAVLTGCLPDAVGVLWSSSPRVPDAAVTDGGLDGAVGVTDGGGRPRDAGEAGPVHDGGTPSVDADLLPVPASCAATGVDIAIAYRNGQPTTDSVLLPFPLRWQRLDLYLLFDVRGSTLTARATLAERLAVTLGEAACAPDPENTPCEQSFDCPNDGLCAVDGRCVENPGERGCAPDLRVGVGSYDAAPGSYRHLVDPTTAAGLPLERLPFGDVGASGPTSDLRRSLACIVSGNCLDAGCAGGGLGCPGFRPDAERLVVAITDAPDGCVESCPTPEDLEREDADERILRYLLDVSETGTLSDETAVQSVVRGSLGDVLRARTTRSFRRITVERRPVEGGLDLLTLGLVGATTVDRAATNRGCVGTLAGVVDLDNDPFTLEGFAGPLYGEPLCWRLPLARRECTGFDPPDCDTVTNPPAFDELGFLDLIARADGEEFGRARLCVEQP